MLSRVVTIPVKILAGSVAIEGLSNASINFEVEESATIGSLKERLKEELGLPRSADIKFKYRGDDADQVLAKTVVGAQDCQAVVDAVLSGIDATFVHTSEILWKKQGEDQKAILQAKAKRVASLQKELKEKQKTLDKLEKSPQALLFQAIQQNDVELFDHAFLEFSDKREILNLRFNTTNHHGHTFVFTPFFEAAKNGNIKIVQKLLEIPGVAIDEKVRIMHFIPAVCPEINRTPLEIAIQHDHLDVVKLLLSKGANPDCFYCGSPSPQVTNVVAMYKYRADIKKELASWGYQNITIPVKKHSAFFKDCFPQDKADKLQVANLVIRALEGGGEAAKALGNLDDKQKLAIGDGRLKVAFENIKAQFPQATNETAALIS